MAAEAYWLDSATLNMETAEATSVPVAGIQDITVIPAVSVETLYTGDSIKVEEKQQHEFLVNVQIGFSKWDLTLAEEWLGGEGATGTAMADTSDPQKFTMDGDFTSVGGGTTYNWEVSGITFEEMPIIDGSRGEFIQWDLDGEGEDLVDLSAPV